MSNVKFTRNVLVTVKIRKRDFFSLPAYARKIENEQPLVLTGRPGAEVFVPATLV